MTDRRLERFRRLASPVENAALDELAAGRMGRRDFLRYASVIGFSAPLLACDRPAGSAARPGGVIRVGIPTPAGLISPLTVADTGGVCMLSQTAEFLCLSLPDQPLQPVLATGWSPNADGSVWTFKIRTGVKFHDGRTMTARDVVASIDRLADPANGSIALSAFRGVLSKGGSRYVDDETVEFHLDAPNGSFPYLVSTDNFNAVILPADYKGDFEKTFVGTGAFKLEKYAAKDRASFVRNDDYWGDKALPDRTVFIFYDSIQAQVLAMQGGQLDVLLHIPVHGAQALLNDPRISVVKLRSSAHEQMHMRCDRPPFTDKRVRRAMALTLDREALVQGMFKGMASVGNDSPFAPIFPATDPTVPQRRKDIREARALMAGAGYEDGFAVTLTPERFQEIPDYAVVVQNAVKPIGVAMSGAFNAAHFSDKRYDTLVAGYIAALDPAAQRAAAGEIQRLLLDETPIVASYFYDWLSVTRKSITGVRPTAMSQLYLDRAEASPL
ncbi:MAG: peptide ABC transporter substrate-binding protein [Sphingomonas sp. 32-66-10]|nr:MAG: peptide ABC transporter substrate-binding protein [Sphingomonas sp. 32-66-10]